MYEVEIYDTRPSTAKVVGFFISLLIVCTVLISLGMEVEAEKDQLKDEIDSFKAIIVNSSSEETIENKEVMYYSDNDAILLAKVTYLEARGIENKTELACVMWTILNRVDAGYGTIEEVITAPNQFAYSPDANTVTDHGVNLVELAYDVLARWNSEKNGKTDVGRVLPADYLWYAGNGEHNYFRNEFRTANKWDYSLPSPYE